MAYSPILMCVFTLPMAPACRQVAMGWYGTGLQPFTAVVFLGSYRYCLRTELNTPGASCSTIHDTIGQG